MNAMSDFDAKAAQQRHNLPVMENDAENSWSMEGADSAKLS
jgi:hypothetical protein